MIQEIKKKLEYFNDPLFTFDEPTHIYRYNGEVIFGATSFLERFKKTFDREGLSLKKANELKISQQEILEIWDNKRDRACDLGHDVHTYIENYYEKGLLQMEKYTKVPGDKEAQDIHKNNVNERIKKFHTIYENKLKQLESIGSEIRVFSKIWKIAGTIDKLFYYEGSIIVGDWKSNGEIKTDDDYAYNKLLYPFEKYKENEINKYSLQTSLYQLMLEEAGINSDYSFICHLPPGENEAKIYKMKDFRAELRTYLNHMFLNEPINENKIKELNQLTKLW